MRTLPVTKKVEALFAPWFLQHGRRPRKSERRYKMATYRERTSFREQLPAGLTPLRTLVAMVIFELWVESVRQGHSLMPRNAIVAQMVAGQHGHCSVRTVQRATAALDKAGILDKIRRFRQVAPGLMRRMSNQLRLILKPAQQAFRRLQKLSSGLMYDRAVTVQTSILYSDTFIPSETYKRLMKEGLWKDRG